MTDNTNKSKDTNSERYEFFPPRKIPNAVTPEELKARIAKENEEWEKEHPAE